MTGAIAEIITKMDIAIAAFIEHKPTLYLSVIIDSPPNRMRHVIRVVANYQFLPEARAFLTFECV